MDQSNDSLAILFEYFQGLWKIFKVYVNLQTLELDERANWARDIAFGSCVNSRNNGIELLLYRCCQGIIVSKISDIKN